MSISTITNPRHYHTDDVSKSFPTGDLDGLSKWALSEASQRIPCTISFSSISRRPFSGRKFSTGVMEAEGKTVYDLCAKSLEYLTKDARPIDRVEITITKFRPIQNANSPEPIEKDCSLR